MKSILLAALFLTKAIVSGDSTLRISDSSEIVKISKDVNSGTIYYGTTILLEEDLDFSGKSVEPIGNSTKYRFRGIFDGQGHMISNLAINSSFEYVGLFGYSSDLKIKNVVIDNSCSVLSVSNIRHHTYTGGLIGYCENQYYGYCSIENTINMGSVTFNGNTERNAYLGGLVGYYEYDYVYYATNIKNCANYGTVTHSGISSSSYMGGITGCSYGRMFSVMMHIQNCLNYGDIIQNGAVKASTGFCVGGIVGYSDSTDINNCVNYGSISLTNSSSYIGSIVGRLYDSLMEYCYWSSNVKYNGYGYKESYYSVTLSNNEKFDSNFILNNEVSIGDYKGTSLIAALNAFVGNYSEYEYPHWLLNKNGKTISFKVNTGNSLSMNYKIIILPSLANYERFSFDGWYTNSIFTTQLTDFEINTKTNLYGKWKEDTRNYTITYNTRGGTPINQTTGFVGSFVSLPSSSKDGCWVSYWVNESGDRVTSPFTIPPRNVDLYAIWGCTRITTSDDFSDFSKLVNSGRHYYGTTVFLDSDIDMQGIPFEPIGNDYVYFNGTFDGQGHVISNLKVNSSSEFTGLFGYLEGAIIRNVVIDDTCTFVNSFSGPNSVYLGAIISYYFTRFPGSKIENNINMANITFNGNVSSSLYLGGIMGFIFYNPYSHSFIYGPKLKNCANYGSVTHLGYSNQSYIGGISGYTNGYHISSYFKIYIQNCLNYGNIILNENSTSKATIGGVFLEIVKL